MSSTVVPVIYDLATRQVLRWFSLDDDAQMTDSAFNPLPGEGMVKIPRYIYDSFGRISGAPALNNIQNYVNSAAP